MGYEELARLLERPMTERESGATPEHLVLINRVKLAFAAMVREHKLSPKEFVAGSYACLCESYSDNLPGLLHFADHLRDTAIGLVTEMVKALVVNIHDKGKTNIPKPGNN